MTGTRYDRDAPRRSITRLLKLPHLIYNDPNGSTARGKAALSTRTACAKSFLTHPKKEGSISADSGIKDDGSDDKDDEGEGEEEAEALAGGLGHPKVILLYDSYPTIHFFIVKD